jgi:hypothetical protein
LVIWTLPVSNLGLPAWAPNVAFSRRVYFSGVGRDGATVVDGDWAAVVAVVFVGGVDVVCSVVGV